MSLRLALAAGLILAATLPGRAAEPEPEEGADADVDYVDLDAPEPLPLPTGGDIYLRVDGAYRAWTDPDGSLAGLALSGEEGGDAAAVGFGAGYRLGEMLRLDATLDYAFPATLSGEAGCPGACAEASARVRGFTGLLNAYADLFTVHGVTPYVGGGIGASFLDAGHVRGPGGAGTGEDGWSFAWALGAGVGIALGDRLTLDLGYRYLDAGSVDGSLGAAGLDLDDLAAHEVRIGLRMGL